MNLTDDWRAVARLNSARIARLENVLFRLLLACEGEGRPPAALIAEARKLLEEI